MSKERISRIDFVKSIKANPSAFCGLVYTLPDEEVSADCINAIRITAKEIEPRRVKATSYTTVTFDDDSKLLIGTPNVWRRYYLHDNDLLEVTLTERGSDITKHLFYLVARQG